VKTGTNAAESAAWAKRLLTRFGIELASANADAPPVVPKNAEATTSRPRPATRDSAVKIEKIAVLRATPRPAGTSGAVGGSAASVRKDKAAL
jgi:hypothetical protein